MGAALQILPIRGNVPTRVAKVERGEYDAVVLARAGLERIGLGDRITEVFDAGEFLPAAGQGALAVEVRSDDARSVELVGAIDDAAARLTAECERQILVTTQCGCRAPVGALARVEGEEVEIRAFICGVTGGEMIRQWRRGPVSRARELAVELAEGLLDAGGREIVAELRGENGG
jgi:hydroxymethylbilane synthase